ncbi:S8 family serine peptidase [Bacillus cereus]|uniref:Peptidase n=1 Tax=Bacillus thuringiensis TaxID=1428 RepID=A0AB36TLJ1_BACTU|nr:S8 family serine peptidase [Bacillus thuringiensis]MDA2519961.1 S8 family serine peptidase [Bacillus cereus]PEE64855.1 peptidase [Bacillus thuringiensis]PEE86051.1 peptidase [Bacillus thuringiensis]PFM84263.1 peptidase [Bacillus thuringiensis]
MVQELYTYRAGKKVLLQKRENQFVIRTSPDNLKEVHKKSEVEQVSPASFRITTDESNLEDLMNAAREIAPAHHAYYRMETNDEFLITDRIFVKFRKIYSEEEVILFTTRYKLVLLQKYDDYNYLFQLTNATGMNPIKLIVKLMEEEVNVEVADHDLNHRMHTYDLEIPHDESYSKQWHLHTHFRNAEYDLRSSTRCEDAWKLLGHFGSEEVVIGFSDDGCKVDHPDFNSTNKFASYGYFKNERLFVNTDSDFQKQQMYITCKNHGTSCAGVIAAEVDAQFTVGAAPGCRLLPIKWESNEEGLFITDSKLMTVLNYIADKVDVFSNSWGRSPERTWPIQVLEKITELTKTGGRRRKGIVFLWAAGNENCPIEHNALVDVPYTDGWENGSWVGVIKAKNFHHSLVSIPGVMFVGALSSLAQRSHYSNYGFGLSITAPSSNLHEYFRMPVKGVPITTTTGSIPVLHGNCIPENVTSRFGGTSSATPLVAGIAALTISANPHLSALEVISILKSTASKNLNFEGYSKTPPSSFDMDTSWDISPIQPFNKGTFINIGSSDGTWSPWFGHGRVDAFDAVKEALKRN